jgi:phage terminase small subunit
MTDKTDPVHTDPDSDLEGLNTREKAFVLQYIICNRNGTRAATAAGYSAKTAYSKASQLLSKVEIKDAIQRRINTAFRAMHMDADETLALLARQARFSLSGLIKVVDGAPVVDLENATQDQLDALAEASLSETGVLKIKGPNVLGALTTLAKIQGLMKDQVEVSVTESAADIMTAAMERSRRARAEREGGRDE